MMRIGSVVALLAATIVTTATVVTIAPVAAHADTAQPGCSAVDPFTPAFAAQLAARWPGPFARRPALRRRCRERSA